MRIFIFLILTFFINVEIFSQDTVKIPQQELEEFFLALDTLEYQDSIKSILIKDLEIQILNYKVLSKQDSLLIEFKKQESILLNQQIDLHLDRLKTVDRWYHKPWMGFIGGVVTTVLMVHVIDYSLPK
mgnify:CR=1 FL=1|tara:strand:- start:1588 stop:1971 length:384 start_codon:yes stop_codon:yes gene_type:complete